jgi:hypothetical protein
MRNLENYSFLEIDRPRIEWDQYGRPYIQDTIGRMMLSLRSDYQYQYAF